ncbi:caspase family protein [Nostoc punctiforme]|uniref:Peptidase C14, caspase catalytic subunit p20 n=1 Tax=Nostoc punctiforme (strain ATCC 29133 / PCC 73102) TaxID=63737 RepID=B2IZZ7_NOSP7|nr:caspase family protein [Nostoc punctiforme]ACC81768.1 peptidase C14, caspase catalytic subunit p20 [Nostoc punctiforme PCC 73102]
MSRSVYALTVGINNYQSHTIPPLKGCVNDITVIDEFLRKHLTNNEDKLFIKKLINHEATRQAIIDGFREHLCQAKSNDVALFYFSGHGSQERAGQEFWNLEPDHLNETLVCWDSRTDDIWDLADKEIAKLIAEVSQNHPHIVIILDCCHSGGGTRDENDDVSSDKFNLQYTGIRSVNTELRERPLSSFILSEKEINSFFSKSDLNDNESNKFFIPQGEYILLAACRDNEEAKEHRSQKRGVFSYFLMDSLQRNGSLNYRDLFKRTNALVRSLYPKQSPQIEATNSNYLDQPFLGGIVGQRQIYFTIIYDGLNGWSIDAGAIHGIIYSNGNEKTRLAIFPINVEDISQLQDAIAVAEITEVLPQLSRINISGEREILDPELTYKAVITSLPASFLKVYLKGEESGVNYARQAIQTASFGESHSLYIGEVDNFNEADVCLQALGDKYFIIRVSDQRQLISPIPGFTSESALQAIHALEHIARWINIATITSPANSLISSDAVQMQVYQQESEIHDYPIYLKYQANNGKLEPPIIRIKLTNKSENALYCVLLNLTELFAVTGIPFAGVRTGILLQPGQEIWALEGRDISMVIPQNFGHQGVTEYTEYKDILKLIVSISEFDADLLIQGNIEKSNHHPSNDNTQVYVTKSNSFNNLIRKIQSRAIVPYKDEPQKPEVLDEWMTSQILIITATPNDDTDKQVKQKNLHRLFRHLRIGLFLVLPLIAIFLGWIIWQKSQSDKSDKQKTSYYNFSALLEKSKTDLNKNLNPVTYDNDLT